MSYDFPVLDPITTEVGIPLIQAHEALNSHILMPI